MRSIRYHLEARADFLDEVKHYSAISPKLAERFDKAVQAAEVRAAETPDSGARFSHGTRRILDRKFKFSLLYLHTDDELVVVAVARFRRRPGYWRARLSEA